MDETALVQFDKLRLALEQANSIGEVKTVHDMAAAARHYAQVSKLGLEATNYAAEIRLRAEHRLGELLTDMDLESKRQQNLNQNSRSTTGGTSGKTLAEMGFTKKESSKWQRIASIPLTAFERYIADVRAHGEELTTAGALRLIPHSEPPGRRTVDEVAGQAAADVAEEVKATNGHVSVGGESLPATPGAVQAAVKEHMAENLRADNETIRLALEREDGVAGKPMLKGKCIVTHVDPRRGVVVLLSEALCAQLEQDMRLQYLFYILDNPLKSDVDVVALASAREADE